MAPRANWKGFLRLSLVTCPVALFPATSESEKISFNQLNRKTGHRIKYAKVDADTGEEVANEDIVKGYRVDTDTSETTELEVATNQHNPENALIEQEDTNIVAAIYGCLDGDDEAQLVIMAIADGKKGKELRDDVGIDQAAYDYTMRRIKKALKKNFPEGLPS
jgi:DNA-directed RNA polymerase specialized sigma24 family protein